MALLIAFGSVAASHEVGALTAAVHDLLAAAGLAASDQSTDALCRAVIAAPTPQQDANPPVMSGKTQTDHGHLSSTDARWTEHVAAVLHAAGSSADHDEALQKLEGHTHPVQTIPPLVDDDGSRVNGAVPSQVSGSARRGGAGAGAGTKAGASKVLRRERQLRRRAEAARDAAEARERDLMRELKRERARRRRAEAA